MNSNFLKGFEKTAGVVGSGIKAVGKGVTTAGGGLLNTALSLTSALGDFSTINGKMQKAQKGLL